MMKIDYEKEAYPRWVDLYGEVRAKEILAYAKEQQEGKPKKNDFTALAVLVAIALFFLHLFFTAPVEEPKEMTVEEKRQFCNKQNKGDYPRYLLCVRILNGVFD